MSDKFLRFCSSLECLGGDSSPEAYPGTALACELSVLEAEAC